MIIGQEKPSLEEALEHFGIRGMKWGVRKKSTSTEGILPKGTSPFNADGSPRVVRDAPTKGFKNKAEADAFIMSQLNKSNKSMHRKRMAVGAVRTVAILGVIGSQVLRAYRLYEGDYEGALAQRPRSTEMWI